MMLLTDFEEKAAVITQKTIINSLVERHKDVVEQLNELWDSIAKNYDESHGMKDQTFTPNNVKAQHLTEEIHANPEAIELWAKTQKALCPENKQWQLVFIPLVKKFPYIVQVLQAGEIEFDDFVQFLRGSATEPVDAKRTNHLHTLFQKMVTPSLLPEKRTELMKYGEKITKSLSTFVDEPPNSKIEEAINALIGEDGEKQEEIKKLFNLASEFITDRIVHDGLSSLVGSTLDGNLIKNSTSLMNTSVLGILTMSNQVNGTTATVKFVSVNQDHGWLTAEKLALKNKEEQEKKRRLENPSNNQPKKKKKLFHQVPSSSSSSSSTSTTTSSKPIKPPVNSTDYICGLCREKGHKTHLCPNKSEKEKTEYFQKKRGGQPSQKKTNCTYLRTKNLRSTVMVASLFPTIIGTKVIVIALFSFKNDLIPVRIWIDTGSSISLISSSSKILPKVVQTRLEKPVVAVGIGGEERLTRACEIELKIKDFKFKFCPFISSFEILKDEKIDVLLGTDVIGPKLGLNITPGLRPHLFLRDDNQSEISENSSMVVEKPKSVRKNDGVKQSSAHSSAMQIETDEASTPMELENNWGLAAHQDGVNQPNYNLSSGRETEGNNQLIASMNLSNRKFKVLIAANHIERQDMIKFIRKQHKLNRQFVRKERRYKRRIIGELLKLIKRYPSEEIKTDAFVCKKQKYNNPKNRQTPISEDSLATVGGNSIANFIKRRKLKRKIKKAAVLSMQITAEVNQPMLEKMLEDRILLQDPPDRDETFVPHILDDVNNKRLNELLDEFKDVIVEENVIIQMGQSTLQPFDIELVEGGEEKLANAYPKAYPARGPKRELLKKAFEDLEKFGGGTDNDINAKCCFASPAFLAQRKRTKAFRLCLAFNLLNSMTVTEVPAIPNMEELINLLKDCIVFSILDLRYAYNQVRLTERAMKYAGIIHPMGVFALKVMSFGFKNAPAHFQKNITAIFKVGLYTFVVVYIDDIIVFSKSFEEHFVHLRTVLETLRSANLKCVRTKIHLFMKQMKALGFIVNGNGITTNKAVVQDLLNFPAPRNKNGIRSFLGLAGVFEKFMYNFRLIAEPLYALLRNENEFLWGEKQLKAFQEIKELLTNAPTLHHFDWNKPMKIKMDASLGGAGAVILQEAADGWHPTAFASWLFNQTQRNYSTTDRELLTLILLTRKFRPLFFARNITCLTDHQPMPGYLTKDPHGRLARWISELSQFNLRIEYIPGKLNFEGDCMSRAWENLEENVLQDEIKKISKQNKVNEPFFGEQWKNAASNFHEKEIQTPSNYYLGEKETIMAIKVGDSLPTDAELAVEQIKDENLKPIIRYLKKAELPDDDKIAEEIIKAAEHYALLGSHQTLVRLTKLKEGRVQSRKVVPKIFYKQICSAYHDTIWMVAHQGRDKTLERISRKFYWNNMKNYIATYCDQCLACLAYKNPKQWAKAKLGNIECNAPWQLVCIDLQGKWVTTSKGYKYTLTVICGFAKFLFLIPIKSKKAEVIAAKLWKRVFSIFGIPPRLHSDRGAEFVNKIIKELTNTFFSKHSTTTAYHPQGNAYAERVHRFVNQALAQYVNQDQNNWDELVPALMTAHNDCIQTAIGMSPAQVILGRHLNLPGHELEDSETNLKYNPNSFAQKLQWALAKAQEIVQGKMAIKIARNAKRSENIKTTPFSVGQAVRLWQPVTIEGKKAKLTQKWFGPYFIRDIKNEGRVIYLNDADGNNIPMPVSINRIWPYPKGLIEEKTSQTLGNSQVLDLENEKDSGESLSDSESDDDQPEETFEVNDDTSGVYLPSDDEESESEDSSSDKDKEKKQSIKKPKLVDISKSKYEKLRDPPTLRKTKQRLLSRPMPKLRKNPNNKNKKRS